jgi:hypothetical protein
VRVAQTAASDYPAGLLRSCPDVSGVSTFTAWGKSTHLQSEQWWFSQSDVHLTDRALSEGWQRGVNLVHLPHKRLHDPHHLQPRQSRQRALSFTEILDNADAPPRRTVERATAEGWRLSGWNTAVRVAVNQPATGRLGALDDLSTVAIRSVSRRSATGTAVDAPCGNAPGASLGL